MKNYHENEPLADGDYRRANYNREKRNTSHDRYPSRDDHAHQNEAQQKNNERGEYPRESSFRGNISQNEGHQFEKEAGYRERFRKTGEGYPQRDQHQAWPHAQGTNRGKGSKNYQRSDQRILDDVHQKLTDHPGIDATHIEVTVENGDLILAGSVETREAKRMTEDICEQVRGVKNVENRLRVQHSIGNGASVGNP